MEVLLGSKEILQWLLKFNLLLSQFGLTLFIIKNLHEILGIYTWWPHIIPFSLI